MTILPKTINFKNVKETKDLPVSWMSTLDTDIKRAGAYEMECKDNGIPCDPGKIAELIGGKIAHLRQTTLNNGLKFVTIHLADGTQIFDDHEYGGLFSCDCGHIKDLPCAHLAEAMRGADLGDGFVLNMTISGRGGTTTYAEKKFTVEGKKVEIHYSVEPESEHEAGYLTFAYKVVVPGEFTFPVKNMSNGGTIEEITETTTAKNVEVRIRTEATSKTGGEKHPVCRASVSVAYNLPIRLYTTSWDQVEFKFGIDGAIEEVVGISQSDKPNPDWKDEELLKVIRKAENEWFQYSASSPEAALLARVVFGKDITELKLDTQQSLSSLLKAATDGADVNLPELMAFLSA